MSEDRHPLLVTVVAAVLLTAAVATGSQFVLIQDGLSDQYEALETYPGLELGDLVGGHFESTQSRFLLYAHLREHASGTRVVSFRGAGLSGEQLRGLSGVAEVEIRDIAPTVGPNVAQALDGAVVASGEDATVGTYTIAVGPQPTELLAFTLDGGLVLADRALLDDEVTGG